MERRTFIKSGALALATSLIANNSQAAKATPQRQRTLVLVELRGGNDGLNTLIPFTDPLYYQLRPNLAIPKQSAIPITESLALHPAMKALMRYWQHKEIAWLQGVGYPNNNRSHFRSIDIWNTASHYNQTSDTGWIARLLGSQYDISGVAINSDLGPLVGQLANGIKINDINAFIRNSHNIHNPHTKTESQALAHLLNTEQMVVKSINTLKDQVDKAPRQTQNFPNHQFGKELSSIARLINSGVNIPSYKISLSNFDTHAVQSSQHARLLKILADSLHAFALCMKRNGHWDDVIVMTYSEFGRQIAENNSHGTDHGDASTHLIMGGKVKGGIYGANPNLGQLHQNALPYGIDFRSIYGTIASRWWQQENPWNKPLVPFV
ncbi:MAG: DUF1501 domain-containing protein [Leucothrix sp.]